MAGSAFNLDTRALSQAIGGPVEMSAMQQKLFGPNQGLAQIGKGLFGDPNGGSSVDPSDPQAMLALAKKAMLEGDPVTAKKYQDMAAKAQTMMTNTAKEKRAVSGYIEGQQDRNAAKLEKARELNRESDTLIEELRQKPKLVALAINSGIPSEVARAMDVAELKKELNLRDRADESAARTDARTASTRAHQEKMQEERQRFSAAQADQKAKAADRAKLTTEERKKAEKQDEGYAYADSIEGLREYITDPKKLEQFNSLQKALIAGGPSSLVDKAAKLVNEDDKGRIPNSKEMESLMKVVSNNDTFGDVDKAGKIELATRLFNLQSQNPDAKLGDLVDQIATEYNVEDKNWSLDEKVSAKPTAQPAATNDPRFVVGKIYQLKDGTAKRYVGGQRWEDA